MLSTLIYHPDFLVYADYLKDNYFKGNGNAAYFWAIKELYQSGVENIDALNLSQLTLPKTYNNNQTQTQFQLQNLMDFVDKAQYVARNSVDEFMLAVKKVISLAFKRDLSRKLSVIKCEINDPNKGVLDINRTLNRELESLTQQYIVSSEITTFGNVIDDVWAEIESRRNESGSYGIPSKFPMFEQYFAYEAGELVLLKARMKRGKSAFFLNEAVHKLQNGIPTLYLDTEMSDKQFLERILANLSGIEVRRIKMGNYTVEEGRIIEQQKEWLKRQPFVHKYIPSITDEEIYAIHKILKTRINLQFSIYDYIKSNVTSSSENYNILGQKCDFLKNNIAGELNIAMLAGAQLNRNNLVADSDKLERYVSTSIMWDMKSQEQTARDGEQCGNFMARVDLNRNGEMMDYDEYIDFNFDGNRMRIVEAQQHINESPFSDE